MKIFGFGYCLIKIIFDCIKVMVYENRDFFG